MEKQYANSADGETFSSLFDTRKEAVEEIKEELEKGDSFYIGEVVPIKKDDVRVDVEGLLETVEEAMGEEVGDVAEDWLWGNTTDEEEAELEKLIVNWIWRKRKPTFYKICNVKSYNK